MIIVIVLVVIGGVAFVVWWNKKKQTKKSSHAFDVNNSKGETSDLIGEEPLMTGEDEK